MVGQGMGGGHPRAALLRSAIALVTASGSNREPASPRAHRRVHSS